MQERWSDRDTESRESRGKRERWKIKKKRERWRDGCREETERREEKDKQGEERQGPKFLSRGNRLFLIYKILGPGRWR